MFPFVTKKEHATILKGSPTSANVVRSVGRAEARVAFMPLAASDATALPNAKRKTTKKKEAKKKIKKESLALPCLKSCQVKGEAKQFSKAWQGFLFD